MSYLSGLLDRKGQKAGARLLSYMPKEFVCLTEAKDYGDSVIV